MSDEEISWVNEYHEKVRTGLLPLLETDEQRQWLIRKTEKLCR